MGNLKTGDTLHLTAAEALISKSQQLQETLSGPQVVQIFDYYLYRGLKPLASHTSLIQRSLADIFAQSYSDYRRKISAGDKTSTLDTLFTSLVTFRSKTRWEALKSLQLDRSLLMQAYVHFDGLGTMYLENEKRAMNCYMQDDDLGRAEAQYQMYRIEHYLGVRGDFQSNFSPVIKWVRFFIKGYLAFKELVVGKYYKLSYRETGRSVFGSQLHLSRDDLFQNLNMAVMKALDKYSPEQGTIAAYVQQWFKQGKTNPQFSHEYGQAYRVGQTLRRTLRKRKTSDVSFSQPLSAAIEYSDERPNAEQHLSGYQQSSELINFIGRVKGLQLAKLTLGIVPELTDEQKQMLSNTLLPKNREGKRK